MPADAWPTCCWMIIAKRYNLEDFWVLDLWPIVNPILIITNPKLAARFTQSNSLPKAPFLKAYLGSFLGKRSMALAEGAEWKRLRAMFNPGFSRSHIMSLVPNMTNHIQIFREKLMSSAKSGGVVLLQEQASLMSIDIIGQVVLGVNLGSQLGYGRLARQFSLTVAAIKPHVDWFGRLWNAPSFRWHLRKVELYISEAIAQRYACENHCGQKSKVAIDLALRVYRESHVETGDMKQKLDKDFFRIALDNVKALILGGHDTSGAVIAYALYFLTTHPNILAQVRAEHDHVFGKGTEETIQLLRANPNRLNHLPLTTAVIKETLRLRPPGLTFRAAPKGTYLDWKGIQLPAWGFDMAVFHYGVHHHPSWTNPEVFRPDRFLAPNVQPKDAWRPFEKGPRQCIGHELGMIEIHAALLLTLRDFDFEPAYEKGDPSVEGFGGQACKSRMASEG